MLELPTVLLAVTAAINLGLAAFVYTRDRRRLANIAFALFALFLAAWSLAVLGFRSTPLDTLAPSLLRLSYIAALLIGACFYVFSLVYPGDRIPKKPHLWFVLACTSLLAAAILHPSFLVTAIGNADWGRTAELNTAGFLLFAIVFGLLFLGGQLRLWLKHFGAQGRVRQQLFVISLSVTVIGLIGIYYNLALPSPFLENFRWIWTGPLFTSVFAVIITYAIFRFRLFDAKALAAEVLVFSLWLILLVQTLLAPERTGVLTSLAVLLVSLPVGVLLLRSIAHEVQTREALAAANSRLKELDRLKSEFVSIASHQLRGPVTAIRGYADLMLSGDYGRVPKALNEPIGRIAESTRVLAGAIEDYLNVSRIEQGRMKYAFEIADLADIAESVVEQLQPVAKERGIELQFETDGSRAYTARLDVGKMTQVATNLVDNAIKYTPQGEVRVSLAKDKDTSVIRLSVQDTGIGIDAETLPRLFQKYSRAKGAHRVNASGSGLGLYVARLLVEAQKGRLWAESEGKNQGSTFLIELPAL